MKLTTLAAPLLAWSATVEGSIIQTPQTETNATGVKRYWTRLNLPRPLMWWQKGELRKKEIDSFYAEYKNYEDNEEWAYFILIKCKTTEGCNSCISFEYYDSEKKKRYWWGYLFSRFASETDYEKNRDVTGSIAYTAFIGSTPPSAEDNEQSVLDL